MRAALALVAAVLSCASLAAAQTPAAPPAQPRTFASIDAAGLVTAFQRAGFTAETHTENGETLVFGKRGASSFQATLSNCTGARCSEIELFVAFAGKHIAWERINGWNARTRFARAFLDEKHTPSLQMDLSLDGGVTPAGLQASLKTWGASVDTFALFLAAPASVGAPVTQETPRPTDPITLPRPLPGFVRK